MSQLADLLETCAESLLSRWLQRLRATLAQGGGCESQLIAHAPQLLRDLQAVLRQGALLFERLATNRDPAEVLAIARAGRHVAAPGDVLKNPLVLEFLDLRERPFWHERDLEQAIIDRLEEFLLELGRGFLFAARQKRITIDGDHYYVDLVFYNRLRRAWVLFELKLGKLTPQDLGQIRLYVNYFDRFERAEHEAPTIGIVLCSSKNDAMVKIALPDCEQVMAARYQMVLPTEEELRAELARERAAAEQLLLQNQAK